MSSISKKSPFKAQIKPYLPKNGNNHNNNNSASKNKKKQENQLEKLAEENNQLQIELAKLRDYIISLQSSKVADDIHTSNQYQILEDLNSCEEQDHQDKMDFQEESSQ